jgi:hypothetical protein
MLLSRLEKQIKRQTLPDSRNSTVEVSDRNQEEALGEMNKFARLSTIRLSNFPNSMED